MKKMSSGGRVLTFDIGRAFLYANKIFKNNFRTPFQLYSSQCHLISLLAHTAIWEGEKMSKVKC